MINCAAVITKSPVQAVYSTAADSPAIYVCIKAHLHTALLNATSNIDQTWVNSSEETKPQAVHNYPVFRTL
jgi:hypothetical protein